MNIQATPVYRLAREIGNRLPFSPQIKLAIRNALLRGVYSRHLLRQGVNFAHLAGGPMRPECCGLLPDLVSVVLPVHLPMHLPMHNQADMLKQSVASVLAQTYENFELIIVDDGSEEAVADVLADASADAPTYVNNTADKRIRHHRQPHRGLPAALNAGFALARGEFWCWTSADNLMQPQMLQRLVEKLRAESHIGMVYADYQLIDENGEPLLDPSWRPLNRPDPASAMVRLPRNTRDLNVVHDNFIGPCFLYRGWIGRLLGDYAPVMGIEDYDYWMRINAFFPLQHLGSGEPLYKYRVHSRSLSARGDDFGIDENTRQLMALEKSRAAYYRSPLTLATDSIGAGWLRLKSIVKTTIVDILDPQGRLAFPAPSAAAASTRDVADTAGSNRAAAIDGAFLNRGFAAGPVSLNGGLTPELVLLSSDTAQKNAAQLLTLPESMPLAILFDYEDRHCQSAQHRQPLQNLLKRPNSLALVRDPTTAHRLTPSTEHPSTAELSPTATPPTTTEQSPHSATPILLLDAEAAQSPLALLAFTRNHHAFHQHWKKLANHNPA